MLEWKNKQSDFFICFIRILKFIFALKYFIYYIFFRDSTIRRKMEFSRAI